MVLHCSFLFHGDLYKSSTRCPATPIPSPGALLSNVGSLLPTSTPRSPSPSPNPSIFLLHPPLSLSKTFTHSACHVALAVAAPPPTKERPPRGRAFEAADAAAFEDEDVAGEEASSSRCGPSSLTILRRLRRRRSHTRLLLVRRPLLSVLCGVAATILSCV